MKAYSLETALLHREKVTELYVPRGRWQEVPSQVFELPELRTLEISGHQLAALPAAIGKLSRLENLLLGGNRLVALPPEFDQLSNLRQLDLSGNAFGKFPEAALRLESLRELDLSGCGLRNLPPSLSRLHQLQRLNLAANKLQQFPAVLLDLPALEVLDLSDNRLRELPAPPPGSWPVLGQLNLAANRLTAVPEGLGNCRLLQRLDLSGNRLEQFPEMITNLPWLAVLDLHSNNIRELPVALGSVPSLQQLDLSGNPLALTPALPPTLRQLNLRNCKLREVPSAIEKALNLRRLVLSFNHLHTLPSSFGQLRNLRQLDLRSNAFVRLPDALLFLDLLEELRGGPPRAGRLLPFLRACRKDQTPGELRRPLFDAYTGNQRPLKALATPLLLRCLRFPLRVAALAARAILVSERGCSRDDRPLGPGAGIALLGQTTFTTAELQQRLPPLGLRYCPDIDANTTHLVIGLNAESFPAGIENQCVFLAEDELGRYLQQAEGKHLAAGAGAESLANLQRLLLSGRTDNLRLAIQLLRGGGVPATLHTDLLIAWKTTTDRRLRSDLRALLERHIPEADKRVLSLPVSLNSNLPEKKLIQNISRLTEGTSFDAEKIRRALEKPTT